MSETLTLDKTTQPDAQDTATCEKVDITQVPLPRDCTFTRSDWEALAPHWFPVAFSQDVTDKPVGVKLLDERIVLYRLPGGTLTAARDLCLHRGVPLSMGTIQGDVLVCAYHGFQYNCAGNCVKIPAHPGAGIPPKLKLHTFPLREEFGLIWVRLVDTGPVPFPEMPSWSDPDYIQVLPPHVDMNAAAGRQMEGFLDVSHFSFVHTSTFGEPDNPVVPNYRVEHTSGGFTADYISTVSNYSHGFKHLNPPDFLWRRYFEVFFPFTARLTVFFPNGQLHIMNAVCPVSARKSRLFVPICRNFDKDAPLQATLDFNAQVFAEDQEMVENQYPEDLPTNLYDEVHIRADKSSITYRKGLAALGLGRSYTA